MRSWWILFALGCGRLAFDATESADSVALDCRDLDASWTPAWSSLIAYYKLDGTGQIADASAVAATVGSDALALNANAAGMTFVPGKRNAAVQFDGVDDLVRVPVPAISTTPGTIVSVAFWMQWNGAFYPTGGGYTAVINAPGYGLLFVNVGSPAPAIGFNTGNSDNYGMASAGLENRWAHLVLSFVNGPSNTSKLHLDGQPRALAQTLGTGQTVTLGTPIDVGGYPSYPTFANIVVDELAIWNGPLSDAEVATLYGGQSGCR